MQHPSSLLLVAVCCLILLSAPAVALDSRLPLTERADWVLPNSDGSPASQFVATTGLRSSNGGSEYTGTLDGNFCPSVYAELLNATSTDPDAIASVCAASGVATSSRCCSTLQHPTNANEEFFFCLVPGSQSGRSRSALSRWTSGVMTACQAFGDAAVGGTRPGAMTVFGPLDLMFITAIYSDSTMDFFEKRGNEFNTVQPEWYNGAAPFAVSSSGIDKPVCVLARVDLSGGDLNVTAATHFGAVRSSDPTTTDECSPFWLHWSGKNGTAPDAIIARAFTRGSPVPFYPASTTTLGSSIALPVCSAGSLVPRFLSVSYSLDLTVLNAVCNDDWCEASPERPGPPAGDQCPGSFFLRQSLVEPCTNFNFCPAGATDVLLVPGQTPSQTPSETQTGTPSPSETPTQTPSNTATPAVTRSPTRTPTATGVLASFSNTLTMTQMPTPTATLLPSAAPASAFSTLIDFSTPGVVVPMLELAQVVYMNHGDVDGDSDQDLLLQLVTGADELVLAWLVNDGSQPPTSWAVEIIDVLPGQVAYTTMRVLPFNPPVVAVTSRDEGVSVYVFDGVAVWTRDVLFANLRPGFSVVMDVGAGYLNDNELLDIVITNASNTRPGVGPVRVQAFAIYDISANGSATRPEPRLVLNYTTDPERTLPTGDFTILSETIWIQDLNNDTFSDLFILEPALTRCHVAFKICDQCKQSREDLISSEVPVGTFLEVQGDAAFFFEGSSFTAVSLHDFWGDEDPGSTAWIAAGRRTSFQWFAETFDNTWETAANFLDMLELNPSGNATGPSSVVRGLVAGVARDLSDPTVIYTAVINASSAINASRFLTTGGLQGDPVYDASFATTPPYSVLPVLADFNGDSRPDLAFVTYNERPRADSIQTGIQIILNTLEPASGALPDKPEPEPSRRPPSKNDGGLNTVSIILMSLGICMCCCCILAIPVVVLLIAYKHCGLKNKIMELRG